MAFRSNKRARVDDDSVLRAFQSEGTAGALKRKRRHFVRIAFPGIVMVFLLNSRLFNGLDNQVVIWIFRVLVVIGFLLAMWGMGSYAWLRWTERVLRANPWVFWTGQVGAATF